MQHIVNIAFDFDDERIKKSVENRIENELNSIVKKIVVDHIAPVKNTAGGMWSGKQVNDWSYFNARLDKFAEGFLYEHKEEVIDLAAKMLVDSYKRTKAWKEKVADVLKEIEDE